MEAEAEAAKKAAARVSSTNVLAASPTKKKKAKLQASCDTILSFLSKPPVSQTLQFVDLRFSDFSSD